MMIISTDLQENTDDGDDDDNGDDDDVNYDNTIVVHYDWWGLLEQVKDGRGLRSQPAQCFHHSGRHKAD